MAELGKITIKQMIMAVPGFMAMVMLSVVALQSGALLLANTLQTFYDRFLITMQEFEEFLVCMESKYEEDKPEWF